MHWAPQVIEGAFAEISTADLAQIRTAQHAVRHELSIGTMVAADYHHYLVEAIGMDERWDRFFEAYCRGLCRDEEALAYASLLKRRGVAIGVISNTNDVHVQWLQRQVPEFASFDSVIFSSDVGLGEARSSYLLAVAARARRCAWSSAVRGRFAGERRRRPVHHDGGPAASRLEREHCEHRRLAERDIVLSVLGGFKARAPRRML